MDLKGLETGCGLFGYNNMHKQQQPTSALDHLYNAQMKETAYDNPLTIRLNQFRLKGIGCDVMFVVGDEQERLLAHKLVLGCSSAVFNAMFYGSLSQKKAARVGDHLKTSSNLHSDQLPHPEVDIEQEDEVGNSISTTSDCLSHSFYSDVDEEEEGEEEEEDASVPATATGIPIPTLNLRNQPFNFDSFSSSSPPSKLQRKSLNHEMMKAKPVDSGVLYGADCEMISDVEVVRVPDISPNAFNIMIGYIYSNFDVKGVSLNDDNVMHTLYAAKKYDLRSLVTECVRYLLNGLSACNAVCLLSQARLFQEDMLLQPCFDMIDKNTDIALQSALVSDIDRDTLICVLSRSQLDPSSELIIFHAAEAWAEAECERRDIRRLLTICAHVLDQLSS
uniref:BTB domain-containing protein n=1 Tax=Ditylenchus dipsaci TaxID=166011 RepID=A0A915DW47_9BILA